MVILFVSPKEGSKS